MKRTLFLLLLAASAGCQAKLPDLPEAAGGDTRSNAAQKMAALLAAQDQRIVGLADEALKPVAATRSAGRLNEVKKVKELKDAYAKALVTLHVLDEATLYLDRELRHSADSFQAGAECFAARGKDYQDDRLRAACLAWAAHFEGLRDRVPYHRERVAALRAELPRTLNTMRQSGQLLDDYGLFLANYPADPVPLDAADPYVQAVRRYVEQFERFERALEIYRRDAAPRPAGPAGEKKVSIRLVKPAGEAVPAPVRGRTDFAPAPEPPPELAKNTDPTPETKPAKKPAPAPETKPDPAPETKPDPTPVTKPEPPPEPKPAPTLVKVAPPPARFSPTAPVSAAGTRPAGPLRTPAPAPSPGSRPSKPPARYPGSARGK